MADSRFWTKKSSKRTSTRDDLKVFLPRGAKRKRRKMTCAANPFCPVSFFFIGTGQLKWKFQTVGPPH